MDDDPGQAEGSQPAAPTRQAAHVVVDRVVGIGVVVAVLATLAIGLGSPGVLILGMFPALAAAELLLPGSSLRGAPRVINALAILPSCAVLLGLLTLGPDSLLVSLAMLASVVVAPLAAATSVGIWCLDRQGTLPWMLLAVGAALSGVGLSWWLLSALGG